jgi:hypothetical protein
MCAVVRRVVCAFAPCECEVVGRVSCACLHANVCGRETCMSPGLWQTCDCLGSPPELIFKFSLPRFGLAR